jgi:ectoine hydroxylase-related dioxygenase (phytanoyl-CoA dioxygenase family)
VSSILNIPQSFTGSIEGGICLSSTDRLLVNAEAKKAFFESGYLILRGVFESKSDDLLKSCKRMFEEVIDEISKEAYSCKEDEQIIYLRGSQVVFRKEEGISPSILRIVGCGSYDDDLLQFSRSKEIVNAFSALLSSRELEHIICQFHPKSPGDKVFFPRHKDISNRRLFDPDWQEVGQDCSFIIGVIALDEMTDQNGPLVIEPLSHLGPSQSSPVTLNMKAGDILFMHPELYHYSKANQSDSSRMTLLTGYCVSGANHANYPGNCSNELISVNPNGSFQTQPAPWKKEFPDSSS